MKYWLNTFIPTTSTASLSLLLSIIVVAPLDSPVVAGPTRRRQCRTNIFSFLQIKIFHWKSFRGAALFNCSIFRKILFEKCNFYKMFWWSKSSTFNLLFKITTCDISNISNLSNIEFQTSDFSKQFLIFFRSFLKIILWSSTGLEH